VRLEGLGLSAATVPPLRDVDRFDDALAVAATIPGSRFASAMAGVITAIAGPALRSRRT
jgi:hypothetical protein